MSDRVLSMRELNRALLARQLLLERSPLSLEAALEQCAGLQTQYAPSAYVALWSRLQGFRREALTAALEQRRAVQATLMRSTIHVVSAPDFHLFAAASREARRDHWLRATRSQVGDLDMEEVSRLVRECLTGRPRRAAELKDTLAGRGIPAVALMGVMHWVDIVRVPPAGTWHRRRADLYGLAEEWLGPSNAPREHALEHLVRRYLAGFGPASLRDVASWTGVPAATLQPVVERLSPRRFLDERGTELLDVAAAPLPDPDTPAPVRFLPTWDATLLVHARRTQVLPEPYRPLVFTTKTPQSVATFLVDGAVAGKWRFEAGRVHLEPFDQLPRLVLRELEEEARGLAELHAE
jgi:Winged helix DNA-binding domain